MKLIFIILTLSFFVSCGTDKDDEPEKTDTTAEKIIQKADSLEKAGKSTEEKPDSAGNAENPPKKSPVLKDQNNKSISELWRIYKKAKNNVNRALDSNDIESIVRNLALAGESAEQLGRMDISSWQFNNIGHYSIVEFKRRTEYDHRLQKLATMPSGKEKSGFLKATKDLFAKEYPLLKNAREYLVRAQIIDDFLEPSRRTEVIQRNIDYIEWVKGFAGIGESL